ncbi:MAG: hypothetical protein SFX72_00870 [Isosphaeraceae bacterium]|nr:hypothetical protein [Isosphaeraceae bacterium]
MNLPRSISSIARHLALLILGCLLVGDVPGHAGLIDFDSVPLGLVPEERLQIVSDGVKFTFTGPGLQIRDFDFDPFFSGRVLTTSGDRGPIVVSIESRRTANFLEIENLLDGRFGFEVDRIRGTAFDSRGGFLDTDEGSMRFLRLDGPGIAKVVFEQVASTGFVIDNLRFELSSVVAPEPSTFFSASAGLACFVALRVRGRGKPRSRGI